MNSYKSVYVMAHAILEGVEREDISAELIEAEVMKILQLYPKFEGIDTSQLIAQLESDLGVLDISSTKIVDDEVLPWLYKEDIEFKFWNRYESFLKIKKPDFPTKGLSDKTAEILDLCHNPTELGAWTRRGMVVGNVQSGKTANYTGLINRAMDSGYKLIIVFAGVHNTLRAQTQDRIDEGVIGRKSVDLIQRRKSNKYGVGEYSDSGTRSVYSYTSTPYLVKEGGKAMKHGDFDINKARELNVPINGSDPTVLVVKKNKSILENLLVWLNDHCNTSKDGIRRISDVPLLVIDDEADNASVNSGDIDDIRTINRLIRTLLNLFTRNTFIGYTATPYANLFIPENWKEEITANVRGITFQVGPDLFPKHFIVNIHPPSNYIGAANVFGFENPFTSEKKESLNLIRPVSDQEPCIPKKLNSKNRHELPQHHQDLPKSMKKAIQSFVLACAIRRARGQTNSHNSMLVHVALYVDWIDIMSYLIDDLIQTYKAQVRSRQGSITNSLHELFLEDFVPTTNNVRENINYKDALIKPSNWEEVEPELYEVLKRIEVRSVHGSKRKDLEYSNTKELDYDKYEEGLTVIAVGGNKLSRGITLEGLSVSYYLRTTKMYDSLMQMGRWFGYRPGYVDLCRLYTTDEIRKWYRHVALATEDMRDDFDQMSRLGVRPDQYQLKVMNHPGMLAITSAAKMKDHTMLRVGYSGKLIQTYSFKSDADTIMSNYSRFKELIEALKTPDDIKKNNKRINELFWQKVNSDVIKNFVSAYISDQPSINSSTLVDYIEVQNKKGELNHWDVAVIANSNKKVKINDSHVNVMTEELDLDNSTYSIGMPMRTLNKGENYFDVPDGKMAILDKRARMIGLGIEKKNPKEKEIADARSKLKKPILVIYPIDPRIMVMSAKTPLIGWGIIFPALKNESTVEYALRPISELLDEPHEEDEEIKDDAD